LFYFKVYQFICEISLNGSKPSPQISLRGSCKIDFSFKILIFVFYVSNHCLFGLTCKIIKKLLILLCLYYLEDFRRKVLGVFEVEIFPFIFKIVNSFITVFILFNAGHNKNMLIFKMLFK